MVAPHALHRYRFADYLGLEEASNTKHEFLNDARTQERTTFADGTTVTVDWERKTVAVAPEL